MEKLDILKELKEMRLNEQFYKIDELIHNLELDIRKESNFKKATDKKKISAIQRVLKNSSKIRPLLSCVGLDKEGNHLITDSYQAYILKSDNYLPFDYALTNNTTDEQRELLNKNEIVIKDGVYPDFKGIIPNCGLKEELIFDCSEIINYVKTTPKENKKSIYKVFKDDSLIVTFDALYMKNAIEILQLDGDFIVEFYEDNKPLIIRNNGNIAIILPIRV